VKIFNPLEASVCQRTIEHDRKFYWVASVKLHISMSDNRVLFEQECIADLMSAMGEQPLPDMGMPKPSGEYLVSGHYFSDKATPLTAGQAEVKFSGHKKTLNIFGDRDWFASVPTKPTTFTTLPLSYEYSFGGPQAAKNPIGKGYQESSLPNIELADQTISSNTENYDPAGFAPMDPSWPQRAQYQGTYDDKYLEKYYPGYPMDMDWRLFMTGPKDQWHKGYYQGNEEYRLKNMHPQRPMIFGHLPNLQPRCFIKRSLDNDVQGEFKELDLNLDTVWFFPEHEVIQLTWRAMIAVTTDDAEEISHVLVGYECSEDPRRNRAHYETAMQRRIANNDPFETNLNTKDLVPLGEQSSLDRLKDTALDNLEINEFSENIDAKADKIMQSVDTQLSSSMEDVNSQITNSEIDTSKKAELIKQLEGLSNDNQLDPDLAIIMEKLSDLLPGINDGDAKKVELGEFSFKKLDALMAEIEVFTAKKKELALLEIKPEIKRLKMMLAESALGSKLSEDDANKIRQQIDSLENISVESKPPLVILPRLNIAEIKEQLLSLLPQLKEAHSKLHLLASNPLTNNSQLVQQAKDKIIDIESQELGKISDQLDMAESGFMESYILGAHFAPDGLSPHEDIVLRKSELLRRLSNNESVANEDWACLDLSGLNLDGVDFSNCLMEQVAFKDCSLVGANFSFSVLARTTMNNSNFDGANFNGANIGAIKANSCSFKNGEFNNSKLSKSDFKACSFEEASIIQPELLEVTFDHCIFDYATLDGWILIERNLQGLSFKNAKLSGFSFNGCEISDCFFDSAYMPSTVWSSCDLHGLSFLGTDMTSNCFVVGEDENMNLNRLDFSGAKLNKANLQKLEFKSCKFHKAELNSANLMSSSLQGANFDECEAIDAQFQKANLNGSSFYKSNLMGSLLSKAKLTGVNFHGSNLYGSDFIRAHVKGCDFSSSNLDATILKDWRPS
jgi:uncharacterized protein YjbI with pentapeptide repeats